MSSGPINCYWTGEVFQPVSPYWARRADKEYGRGEVLRHPLAGLEEHAQVHLGSGMALLGGFSEALGGLIKILQHSIR